MVGQVVGGDLVIMESLALLQRPAGPVRSISAAPSCTGRLVFFLEP